MQDQYISKVTRLNHGGSVIKQSITGCRPLHVLFTSRIPLLYGRLIFFRAAIVSHRWHTMAIVRVTTVGRQTTKIVSYQGDFNKFIEAVRKKFGIADRGEGPLTFVDEKDGAVIEEDVIEEVIQSDPKLRIMVVREGERWGLPGAAETVRASNESDSSTFLLTSKDETLKCTSQPRKLAKYSSPVEQDVPGCARQQAKLIRKILKENLEGEAILAEFEDQSYLQDKTRRLMVNLVVADMMEKHGRTPKSFIKSMYAIGVVNLFTSLKDPHTYSGHEAFFDQKTNTGFLAARIKNVNRARRPRSNRHSEEPSCTMPPQMTGGPLKRRAYPGTDYLYIEPDEEHYQVGANWPRTTTIPACQDVVIKQEETTEENVTQDLASFLNTPGLFEQDFARLFPGHHSKFLEMWPRMKDKVVTLAREMTGKNSYASQLISTVDNGNIKHEGWDSATAIILLLLCLLPPSCQGRAGIPKMSVGSAVDLLIQFEETGASVEDILKNGKQGKMQPYLLATGTSRCQVQEYNIIIDHTALPCCACDVVGAIDSLFKAHFVFGFGYAQPLQNFWTFVQTTIYGVDIGSTRESPRVRELRSKLHK